MIRYDRTPSDDLRKLLMPGGMLAPLLERREVRGLLLDVHLREGDYVKVYCGLTSVLGVRLAKGKTIHLDADKSYTGQSCAKALFRAWKPDDAGFRPALDEYLRDVVVGEQFTEREGRVQALWAGVRQPWIPFDREAVLGYDGTDERNSQRKFAAVSAARTETLALATAEPWATLHEGKVGAELDQLAVDPEGRLVLLELKDAGASGPSVYYSPLQLLQYVHEWAAAIDNVVGSLVKLRNARVELALSPPELPIPTASLRPAIAFGEDTRSAEVRDRFGRVLAIANRHLPAGVPAIEAWAFGASGPTRLS